MATVTIGTNSYFIQCIFKPIWNFSKEFSFAILNWRQYFLSTNNCWTGAVWPRREPTLKAKTNSCCNVGKCYWRPTALTQNFKSKKSRTALVVLEIKTIWSCLYLMILNIWTKFLPTNSADPNQTAPEGAVWLGSSLFAMTLQFLRYKFLKNFSNWLYWYQYLG